MTTSAIRLLLTLLLTLGIFTPGGITKYKIIIISCLYYSQVKPLNHTTGCHAGQQLEVRHGPCVTRGSHSFTCHPHTDHSVCTRQSQGNRPLTGTKLYCLVTGAKNLPRVFTPWCPAETRTCDLLIESPTLYRNVTTPPGRKIGS